MRQGDTVASAIVDGEVRLARASPLDLAYHGAVAATLTEPGPSARHPAATSIVVRLGIPSPSVVRTKLFTLDHRFVVRRAGRLAARDASAVAALLSARA